MLNMINFYKLDQLQCNFQLQLYIVITLVLLDIATTSFKNSMQCIFTLGVYSTYVVG